MSRRPVCFFHFRIREDGQIWLEDDNRLLSARWDEGLREWNIVVVQYGPERIEEG